MEFPDDLWKMIKEYQLDYKTKERFFNNLNSDVYSFNEFTSFYYDVSDDEDYEWRHIVWKVNDKYSDDLTGRCKLVTKDGKTWKLKVEYRQNGVQGTETYNIPVVPEPDNYESIYSKPCYTKGKSFCGNYISKISLRRSPLYPCRIESGFAYLNIKIKYYTTDKSKNKRLLENTILETKRVSKKPKKFTPNFKKPSASSYY